MISNTDLMTRLFLEQILVSPGSAKHCEIAKGCPKYISLVVEVSSYFYRKTCLETFSEIDFCQNLCYGVLSQFKFLSWNYLCFGSCCYLNYYFLLLFELLSLSQIEILTIVTVSVFKICKNLSFRVWSQFEFLVR